MATSAERRDVAIARIERALDERPIPARHRRELHRALGEPKTSPDYLEWLAHKAETEWSKPELEGEALQAAAEKDRIDLFGPARPGHG